MGIRSLFIVFFLLGSGALSQASQATSATTSDRPVVLLGAKTSVAGQLFHLMEQVSPRAVHATKSHPMIARIDIPGKNPSVEYLITDAASSIACIQSERNNLGKTTMTYKCEFSPSVFIDRAEATSPQATLFDTLVYISQSYGSLWSFLGFREPASTGVTYQRDWSYGSHVTVADNKISLVCFAAMPGITATYLYHCEIHNKARGK
jgi:hypothetical protein